jgi:hypothetical protein
MVPQLGTLVKVNLREAWNHEAYSFTPWLAEHLDRLADVIGIPLELEGQEVAVDNFSADILARNPLDDSLVLIENQLECTDHKHLGQIMTYLAGLDAHTVIWLAADFHEAHLSALNWLNEHTVDPFAFFAVKVKAVRIGDSPIAPIFEVMSRPNHWDRRIQSLVQDSRPLSVIGQFRQAFWAHYVARFPREIPHGPAQAVSSRWRMLDQVGLTVTMYLAQKEVGVFIRGTRGATGLVVHELLVKQEKALSTMLNAKIGRAEGDHFFVQSFAGNTNDRASWDELADWLYETANAYESALSQLFG